MRYHGGKRRVVTVAVVLCMIGFLGYLLWCYKPMSFLGVPCESTPVIGRTGALFCVSGKGLYRVLPAGKVMWRTTEGNFGESIAVSQQGEVYVYEQTDGRHYLVAYDFDLRVLSRIVMPGAIVDVDAEGDNLFCAVEKKGEGACEIMKIDGRAKKIAWMCMVEGPVWSVSAGMDEVVYVCAFQSVISVQKGRVIWESVSSAIMPLSEVAIGRDNVYFVSEGVLRGIDRLSGEERWGADVRGSTGNPCVGTEETVYVVGKETIYTYDSNGKLLRKIIVRGMGELFGTRPLLCGDGSIIIPSFDGRIYRIRDDGNVIWKTWRKRHGCPYGVTIGEGCLYVPMGNRLFMVDDVEIFPMRKIGG